MNPQYSVSSHSCDFAFPIYRSPEMTRMSPQCSSDRTLHQSQAVYKEREENYRWYPRDKMSLWQWTCRCLFALPPIAWQLRWLTYKSLRRCLFPTGISVRSSHNRWLRKWKENRKKTYYYPNYYCILGWVISLSWGNDLFHLSILPETDSRCSCLLAHSAEVSGRK